MNNEQLLNLLSLTMVSPHILAECIFNDSNIKPASCLRKAQRKLQKLSQQGYLGYNDYPIKTSGRFRKFYYLKKNTQQIRYGGKAYHKINKGLVHHDSLTALYLTRLYQQAISANISLTWYPPFEVGYSKLTDGGISILSPQGKQQFVLLETDTGTHDHQELAEKIEAYLDFAKEAPQRLVIFVVKSKNRESNIWKTILSLVEEQEHRFFRVVFLPISQSFN